jgi:hypothetical protein
MGESELSVGSGWTHFHTFRAALHNKKRPKKKAKSSAKSGISRFIDDGAESGSDEDDDDDDQLNFQQQGAQNDELTRHEEEALRVRAENRASRAHFDDSDKYVAGLQERHEESRRREQLAEVHDGTASSQLPTIKDPKLYCIALGKIGFGQELMLMLFNKYIAKQSQGQPIKIFSAIAASKKHIYVEAHNDMVVKDALHGLRGVMAFKMQLVPIEQMPEVLSVQCTKVPLEENQWVRMKRMPFKRDLGKWFLSSSLPFFLPFLPSLPSFPSLPFPSFLL